MSSEKIALWLKIGRLVSEDQADEALQILCDYLEPQNHQLLEQLWLLKHRQTVLDKDFIGGIMSREEARIESSRICSGILKLVKMVSEEENST
ncbi:hypothetical protein [Haliscomenobacter hydrossis]|uniref:Effector-associated domain-containing protein n=1 Tax=Haliscomenobacter hydrossis (strain ATCC 27775 / DSM 1100 / LMG 10767 / O) TaxID=760192 RepID=F4L7L5_HALH1|nr:hypothetical protein [Haliscomenobacter hydrossis]AEE54373.1 hypothetical protein Halhy_6557 [Haliscomenobacter hydrossis DSM 1100]